VDEAIYRAAEALERAAGGNGQSLTEERVAEVVREHVPDFFRAWTPTELEQIQADGKIPKWERWKDELLSGQVALDDLLTASALHSFVKDQTELDQRIHRLLTEGGVLS
jgi:transaldolase